MDGQLRSRSVDTGDGLAEEQVIREDSHAVYAALDFRFPACRSFLSKAVADGPAGA
jgi:hypothetical protein